jgi:hypothetical protein
MKDLIKDEFDSIAVRVDGWWTQIDVDGKKKKDVMTPRPLSQILNFIEDNEDEQKSRKAKLMDEFREVEITPAL